MTERTDTVNVRLSNTAVSISDNADTNPFTGKITLKLIKKGQLSYDVKALEDILSQTTKYYSLADLVARHNELKMDNVYADIVDMGKPS
jgi:hypothetical protein